TTDAFLGLATRFDGLALMGALTNFGFFTTDAFLGLATRFDGLALMGALTNFGFFTTDAFLGLVTSGDPLGWDIFTSSADIIYTS
nr:hypothetical protein [Nitrosomonadaceae bacterium]